MRAPKYGKKLAKEFVCKSLSRCRIITGVQRESERVREGPKIRPQIRESEGPKIRQKISERIRMQKFV